MKGGRKESNNKMTESRLPLLKQNIMYDKPFYKPTGLYVNTSVEGESIEQKLERIINNKEPIKDGAPIIYTDRREGVRASTNIRTDRFEIAIEASDKIAKSYKARREEKVKTKDGETESTQGETSKLVQS